MSKAIIVLNASVMKGFGLWRVCRRAEAATGLPHGSHVLLHNGQVLAGRSLCEYGVRKGSLLELVPYYEPSVPQSLPEGSSLLSSPDHELVSVASALLCSCAGFCTLRVPKN